MSKYIQSFTVIPKELFRLNSGNAIRLRGVAGSLKPQRSFDLLTEAGKVQPKALDPQTYEAPNGASMRPNTPMAQNLVKNFKGGSVCVYAVPTGTQIPDDLILIHERDDHYSLQAKKEMTLDELNTKITNFLEVKGQCLTKEQWLQRYPQPTETC
ncbi:hypothetical protein FQN54_008156 [Arachnomyces sp. PD_36]|nr:hypothetical protein FQN54_008156 [Arachnomyces sp. PD_36]